MNLTPVQQQIVDTPGNLIVRASAGTGKTHTMVAKIATEIEHNHTHKSIAAITFTIKAAQEIKDRLTIDSSRHFIGTNNSFVIEEIIKPFLKDVYGAEFEVDMSTDYSIRIDTFEAGLDKVKREQVLCSYTDSKKNFVFDLALDVIMKSSACRLYLQAKYFKIYIDEYPLSRNAVVRRQLVQQHPRIPVGIQAPPFALDGGGVLLARLQRITDLHRRLRRLHTQAEPRTLAVLRPTRRVNRYLPHGCSPLSCSPSRAACRTSLPRSLRSRWWDTRDPRTLPP